MLAFRDELAHSGRKVPLIPCLIVDLSLKNWEMMSVVSHQINEGEENAQTSSNMLQRILHVISINRLSLEVVKAMVPVQVGGFAFKWPFLLFFERTSFGCENVGTYGLFKCFARRCFICSAGRDLFRCACITLE